MSPVIDKLSPAAGKIIYVLCHKAKKAYEFKMIFKKYLTVYFGLLFRSVY